MKLEKSEWISKREPASHQSDFLSGYTFAILFWPQKVALCQTREVHPRKGIATQTCWAMRKRHRQVMNIRLTKITRCKCAEAKERSPMVRWELSRSRPRFFHCLSLQPLLDHSCEHNTRWLDENVSWNTGEGSVGTLGYVEEIARSRLLWSVNCGPFRLRGHPLQVHQCRCH